MTQHTKFATYQELVTAVRALDMEGVIPAVELTPDLATEILTHDPANRAIHTVNLRRLERAIKDGRWHVQKSPPLRFFSDGRLADGQHRCKACANTGIPILVHMTQLPDTFGVDQGAQRKLSEQLMINEKISDPKQVELISTITRAICQVPGADDTELRGIFLKDRDFILECATRATGLLEGKDEIISLTIKPALLAVTRAKQIRLHRQPIAEVDQLLEDVVENGKTAPEGSVRRGNSSQIFDLLGDAYKKRQTRLKDMIKWTGNALENNRRDRIKSVTSGRYPNTPQKPQRRNDDD